MEHNRFSDFRRLGQFFLDVHAVIADRSVAIGSRGCEKGEQAAETIADRADLSGASRDRMTEIGDRCLNVLDTAILIEAPHQVEGAFPLRVGAVAELHARFQPPEKIRREREIAARREFVGNRSHHGIDAENFLNHDQPRPSSRDWRREIAAELAIRAAFDPYVLTAHGPSPRSPLARLAGPWPPGQVSLVTAGASRAEGVAAAAASATASPDW